MKRLPLLLLLPSLLLPFLASCERPERASDSNQGSELATEEVARLGGEVSDQLLQTLGAQLKGALEAGGPVQAIEVCQQVAMPLTEASRPSDGVFVRRTTLRPRNPANAPDELDREVLERMAGELEKTGEPPKPSVEWTEETARFYRPLLIQEVCLKCHGDPGTFPAELTGALASLYPEDQATGYSLGELRGVIRVDVLRN